jgi:hypothetical protein
VGAAVLPVQVVVQLLLLVQLPQVLVPPVKDVVGRAQLLLPVQLPLLVQWPQVLVPLAKDVVVLAQLLLLVLPPLLAQAPREVAVAEEAVHLLTRSFSAAMAGILLSPGPPMYAPAPRSRWKPRRRPCPST